MIREAIILAGGLGTRLRSVTGNLPKCMVRIGGKPFLEYLLQYLCIHDFGHVVLSVGYRHEPIYEHFGDSFRGMKLDYAVEKEPLGTGGGIRLSLQSCRHDEVFILNGDTLFSFAPAALEEFHHRMHSPLTLSLRYVDDTSRYGKVIIRDGRITGFISKNSRGKGFINAGVYLVRKEFISGLPLPAKFSFEKDLLEQVIGKEKVYGMVTDAYFIDIGIPEDYNRALVELPVLYLQGDTDRD